MKIKDLYDHRTAEKAEVPHVAVFRRLDSGSEQRIADIYIIDGHTTAAEIVAQSLVDRLRVRHVRVFLNELMAELRAEVRPLSDAELEELRSISETHPQDNATRKMVADILLYEIETDRVLQRST
jgi:dihydrofolate reductase